MGREGWTPNMISLGARGHSMLPVLMSFFPSVLSARGKSSHHGVGLQRTWLRQRDGVLL